MRIESLEVSGFRAFSGREAFDLDADAVIVVGANGQGKTSLLDAVFWCLAGTIPRLGSEASMVSMYSPSGEARVVLSLRNEHDNIARVVRSSDGRQSTLLLETDGQSVRGKEAEARLLRLLWPQALVASRPEQALVSALERGVYLQQDLVREFIEAESDQDRFTTISELVGAGRVTELQMSLDRSRTAWSRVTNAREGEANELREGLVSLQNRLESLKGADSEVPLDRAAWQGWWEKVARLGVTLRETPEPDSRDAATALDAAVKQLQALELSTDRRHEAAVQALSELDGLPPEPSEDLAGIRVALETAQQSVEQARASLAAAQHQAAEVRRQQVEIREAREQLRVFAELALRHLGERCPVCQQTYDEPATRSRLEALARETSGAPEPAEQMPDVAAAAQMVQERERQALAAERTLRSAEERMRAWQASRAQLFGRLEQLGLASGPEGLWREGLQSLVQELEEMRTSLLEQTREGERLALAVASAGQRARRAEVEEELERLRRELEDTQADVRARQRTGDLVAKMLEALRNATSEVVEAQLLQIEPLVQRVYATADPHPAFRVVKLLTSMSRGRGRVTPSVSDPVSGVASDAPRTVLSSSQMNVLAVSVFMALNLGVPALPLRTVILDDPLQSLDDLNLLGLVDLLRRARERRQVFISTHDSRFGRLLERKLRPVAQGQRTLVIELEGWGRDGPLAARHEVPPERAPVRIAV